MSTPLIDLFRQALSSASPANAMQALLDEHPELPTAASEAWADGFYCERIPPEIAALLVQRGAPLSPHAAAAFGFTDKLSAMLQADPSLVHAKGGDGCMPLHFARDIATAQLLLDQVPQLEHRRLQDLKTLLQLRCEHLLLRESLRLGKSGHG